MNITPLQWLLLTEIEPIARVRQVTGRGRSTVWRWATGRSFPERADAERLIELYGTTQLDHNGCYEATKVIEDDVARALGLLNHKSETPAA